MDRRTFLAALTASGALTINPADAAAPLDATATRTGPERIRLQWSAPGSASPVRAQVLASMDPEAPRGLMRPLANGLHVGFYAAALPASPRPYFLIVAGGRATRVAERLLPLRGGRNFRDLGGYRVADGRQVKWGKIYRSGVMHGLTMQDISYLSGLGVRTICDLRTEQERNHQPTPFNETDRPTVVAFKYDLGGSLGKLFQCRTREDAVQAFADAYIDMTERLAPNFTDMFQRLQRAEAPLAVNCTAGKDRTGMASAFVLSTLGVPRDVIVADYALSQIYVPPDFYRAEMRKAAESGSNAGVSSREAIAFAQMPLAVGDVVLGTDPDVMRLALAKLDAEHGGPLAFAKSKFQLDDAAITRLRALYLTP